MSTDLKTSVHINYQLPEFIREEYPLFKSFMEAYYEFLENKQNGVDNDLITRAKNLKNISDIDLSLDDFEQQFIQTYVNLFPQNTEVTKDFLIKNSLALYKAKGTENSFKFLFRLLFNEELEYERPSDNILKTSDGLWKVENAFRAHLSGNEISQTIIADGETLYFDMLYSLKEDEWTTWTLFIDGVDYGYISLGDSVNPGFLHFATTDQQKFFLMQWRVGTPINTPVPEGTELKIYYNDFQNFNPKIFNNKKLTGVYSGASFVIEDAVIENYLENKTIKFTLDSKSLNGNFIRNEPVEISTYNDFNKPVTVRLNHFSGIKNISIDSSGPYSNSYNVGDQLSFNTGEDLWVDWPLDIYQWEGFLYKKTKPSAIVESVDSSGKIQSILLTRSGRNINEVFSVSSPDYGDSNASFTASLTDVIESLPGNYHSEKGLLSSPYNKIQSQTYYHNYSYITKSKIEFSRYKNIFKSILHPAGFQHYGDWYKLSTFDEKSIQTVGETTNTFSGLVSVQNNSPYITGIGTDFTASVIYLPGTKISVNDEEKTVVSVIDSSNIEVDSVFTANASNQELMLHIT